MSVRLASPAASVLARGAFTRAAFARRIFPRLTLGGALFVALVGCRDLPDLQAGVCGNQVLDPGEICDRDGDASCGQPGTPFQCRELCPDGTCSAGRACGLDGVCRSPSGAFAPVEAMLPAGAYSGLSTGRFTDGGRDELLAMTVAAGEAGLASPSVVRFDAAGKVAGTPRRYPETLLAFASVGVAPLDEAAGVSPGEALTDLVLAPAPARDGLLTLRGDPERALLPSVYGQITEESPDVRFAAMPRLGTCDLGFTDCPGGLWLAGKRAFTLALQGEYPERLAVADETDATWTLPQAVNTLVGFATGLIAEGQPGQEACSEGFALAFEGESVVRPYSLCSTGEPQRRIFPHATVSLPPSLTVAGGAWLADLDGDGHLDVVVGASDGGVYLAYGRSDGSFRSAPDGDDPADQRTSELPLYFASDGDWPLAFGHLDDDGKEDFVVPSAGLVMSAPFATCAVVPGYACGLNLGPGDETPAPAWTRAVIADLDGDGVGDVVATDDEATSLDLLISKGAYHNRLELGTAGPVARLAVGDFDGLGGGDVALTERVDDRHRLSFFFGVASGGEERITLQAFDRPVATLASTETGATDALFLAWAGDGERARASWVSGSSQRLPFTLRRVDDRGLPELVCSNDLDKCAHQQVVVDHFLGGTAPRDRVLAVVAERDAGDFLFVAPRIGDPLEGGGGLAPLDPYVALPSGSRWGRDALGLALELDDEEGGRPEAILVAPAEDDATQSQMVAVRFSGEGLPSLADLVAVSARLGGDARAWRGQILAHDVDGHGGLDLVAVADDEDDQAPRLFIGLNRLDGQLPPLEPIRLAGLEGIPRAVGFIEAGGPYPEWLIVTSEATYLGTLDVVAGRIDTSPVAEEGGAVVTVGDFDGDGLGDVVVGGEEGARLLRQIDGDEDPSTVGVDRLGVGLDGP